MESFWMAKNPNRKPDSLSSCDVANVLHEFQVARGGGASVVDIASAVLAPQHAQDEIALFASWMISRLVDARASLLKSKQLEVADVTLPDGRMAKFATPETRRIIADLTDRLAKATNVLKEVLGDITNDWDDGVVQEPTRRLLVSVLGEIVP